MDEGDAEERLVVVADVVAKAGVVATILEDITGLDVLQVGHRLRHWVALLRRT
jgi:hypothetical protein